MTATQTLALSWQVRTVAEATVATGQLRLRWMKDGHRKTADDHLRSGVPGVYVWFTVRVLHETDGRRQVVSHFNKATKGRLVRALLEDGRDPRSPTRLADVLRDLGWVVEDLGSANGTYVSAAVGDIPDEPIDKGHPITSGHVLYLGSWTRIVLHQGALAG